MLFHAIYHFLKYHFYRLEIESFLGVYCNESKVRSILLQKYPDVKCNYYNPDKYPWNVDFYIPQIDTYIELNCHYNHTGGSHKFLEYNKEDIKHQRWIKELQNRIANGKKTYKNTIHVWTVEDPKKREWAKYHNLNFKEFWSVDEVKTWLKQEKGSKT
jgi:hypothetical protein